MIGEITIPERKIKRLFPPFYYVIFADGETCDATGIEAAVANDFVMFDDRLYMPGEDLMIDGRTLLFARQCDCSGSPEMGRCVTISNCVLLRRF